MAGFFQNQLRDAAGGFFGSEYLRDYQHASKTFRTNSYQNAPKFKFLFHVYFDINPVAFQAFNGGRLGSNVDYTTNFGLLVKEVKLPSYSFATIQLNQYNRKRIVQTKIKYDPIEVTFHDDNGDAVNSMWQAYYQYYYNDGSKPGILMAGKQAGPAGAAYNDRNIYDPSITGDQDWGYNSVSPDGQEFKQPFFKNITIFGFNQHNYTAYTLVNPIITSFQHDKYSYSEGGGTMQNTMSVDYETVVYNYGALDGRSPNDIITGFGDEATYDRSTSPIANPGSNGTILGQGGLVDAVGGTLDALQQGDILGAVRTAGTAYNTFKNADLTTTLKQEVLAGVMSSVIAGGVSNSTRNAPFSFPSLGSTPSFVNTAGAAVTGALAGPSPLNASSTNVFAGAAVTGAAAVAAAGLTPAPITSEPVAGFQYNGSNYTTSYPPPNFYTTPPRG